MVEQEAVSEQTSPGNNVARYPRTGWLKTVRDVLAYIDINWWIVIPIALVLYIIFSLTIFVINHHNNISLLLNISSIANAFMQQIVLGIIVLVVLIMGVVAKPWAERDEGREWEWQREEERRQQEEQEHLPPPPGIILRYTLQGHEGIIFRLAWAPDGTILASGSDDNTIRLWNPSTGELVRVLSGHTNDIRGLVWSPDGTLLLAPKITPFASGTPPRASLCACSPIIPA